MRLSIIIYFVKLVNRMYKEEIIEQCKNLADQVDVDQDFKILIIRYNAVVLFASTTFEPFSNALVPALLENSTVELFNVVNVLLRLI